MKILRSISVLWRVMLSAMLCGGLWTSVAAGQDSGSVQVVSSRSAAVLGNLVADVPDGAVDLADGWQTELQVDGASVPAETIRGAPDRLRVSTVVDALTDGRHTTILSVRTAAGRVIDRSQRLFLVDTIGPRVSITQPAGPHISPGQTTFVAEVADDGLGVAPDPLLWQLDASVDGVPAAARAGEGVTRRYIAVTASQNEWQAGQAVTVAVSMQDRAGNRIAATRTFFVDPPPPAATTETARCSETGPDGRPHVTEAKMPVSEHLPVWLHLSTDRIRFTPDRRMQTLVVTVAGPGGQPLPAAVTDAIQLIPSSDLVTTSRSSLAANRTVFEVRQTGTPQSSSLSYLTLQAPRYVTLTNEITCDAGQPRSRVVSATLSTETAALIVPVSASWELASGHRFTAVGGEVRFETSPMPTGRVQLGASWFEVEGNYAWLEQAGDSCRSAIAVATEGLMGCRAQVTLSSGEWRDASSDATAGPVRVFEGTVMVKHDPPRIDAFAYDPLTRILSAEISDQGTPLSDLAVALTDGKGGAVPFALDDDTGLLQAIYTPPEAMASLRLRVTDAAGQTTEAGCLAIDPAAAVSPAEQTPAAEAGRGGEPSATQWRDARRRMDIGRRLAEVMTATPPPSAPVPSSGLPECRFSPQTVNQGQRYVRTCTPGRTIGLTPAMLEWALNDCRQVLADPDYLNPAAVPAEEKLALDWLYRRRFHQGWCADLLSQPIARCGCSWIDDLRPVVAIRHRSGRRLLADIHDSGAPVSALTVDFNGQSTFPGRSDFSGRLPFTLNADGRFTGQIAVPREAGEHLDLTITAVDAAGNRGSARTHAVLEGTPPEVTLELLQLGDWTTAGGQTVNAYLAGRAEDTGGIDDTRTRLWIDATPVPPLAQEGQLRADGLGDGSAYRVYFGRRLDEGRHTAGIEVFDFAGQHTEKQITFDLAYPPRITDFRALPAAIAATGGPALTALIRDAGGDLEADGITLLVDGAPLTADGWYFDPGSGYFAVDGPMETAGSGVHTAHLSAVDRNGNRADAALDFTFDQAEEGAAETTVGGIQLVDVGLWELEHHNGDGRANPGERVRLYPALKNTDGNRSMEQVSALLEAADGHVRIRRDDLEYGRLDPLETRYPIQGFEVDIDPDLMTVSSADPYRVRFMLRATAAEGKAAVLPFDLPVYRPTDPDGSTADTGTPADAAADGSDARISTVTSGSGGIAIRLDHHPQTVSTSPLTLKGTVYCTDADLDWVKAWVNGRPLRPYVHHGLKRFACDVPLDAGDNTVTFEAADRQGNRAGTETRVVLETPAVAASSEVTVTVSAPATTDQPILLMRGRAASSLSRINRVTGAVNGTGLGAALAWPLGGDTGRFEARVPLVMGSNVIQFTAWDHTGAVGRRAVHVRRSGTYTPPSITILQPEEGGVFGCRGFPMLAAECLPGSGQIASLTATVAVNGGAPLPLTTIRCGEGGPDCYTTLEPLVPDDLWWQDNMLVSVIVRLILVTTGGDSVTGEVRFARNCGY